MDHPGLGYSWLEVQSTGHPDRMTQVLGLQEVESNVLVDEVTRARTRSVQLASASMWEPTDRLAGAEANVLFGAKKSQQQYPRTSKNRNLA